MRKQIPLISTLILALLLAGVIMTAVAGLVFTRIDQVVYGDLYMYGLQFNYEWAGPYWTYSRLMLSLLGLSIATVAVSVMLILARLDKRLTQPSPSIRGSFKIDLTRLIILTVLSAGVISLALSISYTLSVLAFIGLGLIFWGAILLYIRPEKYVKETLLDKTAMPSLASLDQILQELGYKAKGIYLPPKYLKDFESSKVYLSAHNDVKLPSPEDIQNQEDKAILKNTEGILITPPGAELSRLFESTLGINFTKTDLHYIEQNMPRLLIEDLEIAQNAQIESESNRIRIKIGGSVYGKTCQETRKLSNIHSSFGCPLCSAIACALAKATGKPITIEKEQTSEDSLITDAEYRLLEEPKEETE